MRATTIVQENDRDIYGQKKIIQTEVLPEDSRIETSLRPKTLEDYIGQVEGEGEPEGLYYQAAKQRGDALDHVLFYGPLRDWVRPTLAGNHCQ